MGKDDEMRIDRENSRLICDVAGHPEPVLVIKYTRTMCGKITDGIGLANGEDACSYVLAFADLEQAYLEAKNFRDRHPPTENDKKLASILGNPL